MSTSTRVSQPQDMPLMTMPVTLAMPSTPSTQIATQLLAAKLDALQQAGAAQFDPAGMHYVVRLLQRLPDQPARVQPLLQAKLVQALDSLSQRFTSAQTQLGAALQQLATSQPQVAMRLQQQLDVGQVTAVRQALAGLPVAAASPLRALIALCAPPDATSGTADPGHGMGLASARPATAATVAMSATAGLKSALQFRSTWTRLGAQQRLKQALTQAPANAGPVNSQHLVLRSMALMHDISPDYLSRFTSYVDTLLCLDQQLQAHPSAIKQAKPGKRGKK